MEMSERTPKILSKESLFRNNSAEILSANSSQMSGDEKSQLSDIDTSFLTDIDTGDAQLRVPLIGENLQKTKVTDIFKVLKPSKKVTKEQDPEIMLQEGDLLPFESLQSVRVQDLPTDSGELQSTKLSFPEVIEIDDYDGSTNAGGRVGISDILTGTKKKKKMVDRVVEIIPDEDEEVGLEKKQRKKKKKNFKKEKKSLIITLKYKPRHKRIAEMEEKMRKSATRSISAKDLFKNFNGKKKSQDTNTLETSIVGSSITAQKDQHIINSKSYLDVLSSHRPLKKFHQISSMKEVSIPPLTREQLHVTYDHQPIQHRVIDLPRRKPTMIQDLDYSVIPKASHEQISPIIDRSLSLFQSKAEIISEAECKISTLKADPRFKRLYDILKSSEPILNRNIWTNEFQPKASKHLLTDPEIADKVKIWLENSFKILKKPTKRPNFKRQKRADDEMNEFIVNDEIDEEATDDESYVPILIITGPVGVGKTSMIRTIVENDLCGYVYEINAGQDRGRKDILPILKELSTTQLVHHTEDTNGVDEFQKGVIFFEDVDILMESDRGFWSALESLLMISRRPIILSCEDKSKIPQNIIDAAANEDSIFELKRQPEELLKNYLYLISLVNGLKIDDEVLIKLIRDNSSDLRKCLNNLQFLAKDGGISPDSLLHLSLSHNDARSISIDAETDIYSFSREIDAHSISDIIENKTKSLINHEVLPTEVLSDRPVLNEELLSTSILPFEFNSAKELKSQLPCYPEPFEGPPYNAADIKYLDRHYFKSKLKNTNRITRSTIKSVGRFLFDDLDEIYQKSVFDVLPSSTYITDVSPIFREFARFDNNVEVMNTNIIKNDPEQRTPLELLKAGQLIKKKFDMAPNILLYGPLKTWTTN